MKVKDRPRWDEDNDRRREKLRALEQTARMVRNTVGVVIDGTAQVPWRCVGCGFVHPAGRTPAHTTLTHCARCRTVTLHERVYAPPP